MNDERIVYHDGSNVTVPRPEVRTNGFAKDFGFGFCCTDYEPSYYLAQDTPQGYRGGVERQLSRKVVVLSFLAMIEVLYIHHGCVASSKWNAVVQMFFAHALTDWAVPFFLLVSGFWFSRSAYVRGTQSYLQLWFKKARTLLVPYLSWVIIGAILVLPVVVFNNYVMHRSLFERTVFEHHDVWKFIDALFGITGDPQGNTALWYVRALLVFFACAPLWKAMFRLHKAIPLCLGLFLTLCSPETELPHTHICRCHLGWFLLGMAATDWMVADRRLPRGAAIVCGFAWVGLALAKSLGCVSLAMRLIPFAGILFLWSISDWTWLYRDFMKATFWIFCLQMPMTGYSHNGPFFIFGKGDCATILILFLTPWLNLAACLLAGDVVRRFAPRAYFALTGGRP